jgi:hypothetical protein
MALARGQRAGYLITWPHLRPGHFTRPQPSFRAIADARKAADILAAALAADARSNTPVVAIDAAPAARPSMNPPRAAAA